MNSNFEFSVCVTLPDSSEVSDFVLACDEWCEDNVGKGMYDIAEVDDDDFWEALDRDLKQISADDTAAMMRHIQKIKNATAAIEFRFTDRDHAALFRLKFG